MNPGVGPFGLTDTTTPKLGDRWVVPVAVSVGRACCSATVTLTYRAKQGKAGSAK